MIVQLIERVINISPTEISRTFHSWLVKVIFVSSIVIGWTVITASVVARFGINFLPVLFLFQALFTITGMLFFSLMAERFGIKKLIQISTVFAIATLVAASLNYSNNYIFLIFGLIANGIFLSQAGMFLSSYIEDMFTPTEAERTFPVIESAETIGGVLGGVFLAFLGKYLLSGTIFWFWAIQLSVFLLLISHKTPKLPFFLENIEKKIKNENRKVLNFNSISQGLGVINRIPFLQVLIAVLLLNWVIAIFVEFQFTKAVDATVAHDSSLAVHEQMLIHGLGTLHIIIHGLALLVELLIANKILTKIGTFSAFLLHGIMTLFGAFAIFFANGFFTSVLFKTNFELSGIIQKNAYENTYYAYRTRDRKCVRELIEGVVFPTATIIGTLALILLQLVFLEEHYDHIISLTLTFLIAGLIFFTFQLKRKYTKLNVNNLSSGEAGMEYMAIEILSQRGHTGSTKLLLDKYRSTSDKDLKLRIIQRLPYLRNFSALNALMKICEDKEPELSKQCIRSLSHMRTQIRKFKYEDKMIHLLDRYIKRTSSFFDKAFAVSLLGSINPASVEKYLHYDNPVVFAQAAIALSKKKKYIPLVNREIRRIINAEGIDSKWALIYLSHRLRGKFIKEFIYNNLSARDDELRTIALICALRNNKFYVISELNNLLLFGNELIFEKALEVLNYLDDNLKRRIAKALTPYGITDTMPDTQEARQLIYRMMKLYKVCEAGDEMDFMQYNIKELIPIYTKVRI